MTASIPTRGQLERSLSQRIQALYRNQLGHRLGDVICQMFDQKIAIVLENSITQPERVLINNGKEDLAEQVREDIDEAIHTQLRELIEEVVGVNVIDLLSDATLETERTGIIAVLAEIPKVRDRNSIPKIKKDNTADSTADK
jgi:uncharacterized protein YbcI